MAIFLCLLICYIPQLPIIWDISRSVWYYQGDIHLKCLHLGFPTGTLDFPASVCLFSCALYLEYPPFGLGSKLTQVA